jgi:thiol-disulfide isomerase/thioredoxin
MKYLIALALIVSITNLSFSQNDPVPAYLTTQPFPDSVKALPIHTVDGTSLTFGDMLEKHKGKKILIDIWGSWCRDCIIGYPKLEELRNTIGDKDIAYVFLSTDKDKDKWKNAITKFNIRGDHYLLDGGWKNPLSNYISLDWVPRYLVLDKRGRIMMPKAIVAEDEALKEALQ